MGSQNSSTNSLSKKNNKKNTKKNNDKGSNTSSIHYNDSSSYKGIITDTTSINGSSLTSNSLSDKNDNQEDKSNEIKIPTLFEWKEGGNDIIITGSFCGWKHRFTMALNKKTNNYELLLYLPKGEYQFKFIIDNVWKCSSFYEKVTDNNNNTNNIIDNTKQLTEKIKEREKENLRTADTTPNNNFNDKKKIKKDKKNNNNATINLNEEMKKIYGIHYPIKEQLNEEPPILLQSYTSLINFSNYSYNKEKYIYNILKNNLIRETFKLGKIPTHVYLNHLFMSNEDSKNYLKITSIIRIRRKFTSIIYYHPKRKNN